MKNLKTIFKILVILFLVIQYSFAASKPVPSIGIVVKKQPGSSQAKIVTSKDGSFFSSLEAGEYEISFSQDQLRSAITGLIKRDFPESTYQFDGSGVELDMDDGVLSVIRVDQKTAIIKRPGLPDQQVSLPRRSTSALIAEELRRLDPDDMYGLVISKLDV